MNWLILLIILLVPSLSQATTYYIATPGNGGSDSNPGTIGSPWATFGKAGSTTTCGDTTYVRGGTYTHDEAARFGPTTCSLSTPLILINYPGERPIWHPTHYGESYINRFYISAASGFTVPITDVQISGIEMWGLYECVKLQATLRFVFRNNYCHGSMTGGITGTGTGGNKDAIIDRNIIASNGDITHSQCAAQGAGCNQFHGMYIVGTGWTITNNLIYNNLAYGIQTDSTVPSPTPNSTTYGHFAGLIANNTIAYQKNRAGLVLWQNGASLDNLTVENNIFYENSQNYASSAQGYDVAGGCCTSNVIVTNNHWYGTGNSTAFRSANGSNITYTAGSNTNPLFTNGPSTVPTSPDFHLQATSPAIGVGLNLYTTFTLDYPGNTRSATGPWTAGAYTTTSGGGGSNTTVLVWSDTFNRAAEDPLTASHYVLNSAAGKNFLIPSNAITMAQPKVFTGADAMMAHTTTLNADQYCKITFADVSATNTDKTVGMGPTVRAANGAKTGISGVGGAFGWELRRDVAGAKISLGSAATPTFALGDSFEVRVHGTTPILELIKNGGTPFATITDNNSGSLQSGLGGLFYSSTDTGQTPGSSTHGIDYLECGNYFFGLDVTPPAAPTGLTVTANLPAQLLISWTAATDNVAVTGYNIQACTPSVCTPSATISSPTITSYTYTGLADATGYSVRVNAFDAAANQSAFSSVVSTTTQTVASPTLSNAFPSGTAVSDASPITINVTTSIPSVCKYNTRTEGTAAYAALLHTMTISGLVASASVTPDQHGSNSGVNHFYIACDNAASAGHTSSTLDMTFTMIIPVDVTAPSTISDLAIVALDTVRLQATWTAATDAVGVTGYLLSGCAGAGCTSYNITLNAGPGTTSAILALDASTTYNFIIQAYDLAGNNALASNVATSNTFASAAPEDMLNLAVSAILQHSVILGWTAPLVEAPTALIEQCTPKTSSTTCSGSWAQVSAIPLGDLPLIAGLASNTSYCFRGKFANAQNGVSANASNITCVTTLATGLAQPRQPALIPRLPRVP